jgi:hypothetical protein
VPWLGIRGAIPPLPNTPSWYSEQLKIKKAEKALLCKQNNVEHNTHLYYRIFSGKEVTLHIHTEIN